MKAGTDKEALSRWLLWFAWAIEITAIIIGVAISVMIGIDTYNNIQEVEQGSGNRSSFANLLNVSIAVAPFFLVAIVEAAKIPVATAAYSTVRLRYKAIFTIMLVFLAFITFETSFNGFERNFANLTYVINSYKKDLVAVEERIDVLKEQRQKTAELTAENIEESFTVRRNQLVADRDKNVALVQRQIGELKASVETSLIATLKEDVHKLEAELQSLRASRDKELDFAKANFNDQLNTFNADVIRRQNLLQNQLKQKEREIEDAYVRREEEMENAGLFGKGSARKRNDEVIEVLKGEQRQIQEQLNKLDTSSQGVRATNLYNQEVSGIIDRYERKIAAVSARIEDKQGQIARNTALREQDIRVVLDQHYAELRAIETNYQRQAEENNAERARLFDKLKNNQQEIDLLDKELAAALDERTTIRTTINEKVGDNQVYRMTQAWTGRESAADVSRDEVALTGLIWFGSLSAVIALTGIILALASCVIGDAKREKEPDETSGPGASLWTKMVGAGRRFFIYGQKYWRTPRREQVVIERTVPTEVVKEVPVQKVVKQEVPVEIVKKVLVHVPMYTTDKDLVEKYNATALQEAIGPRGAAEGAESA